MRILEVVTSLDGGGVDRLMYDYCSRMVPDIQFDFIAVESGTEEGILEAPLKKLGCNIFHVVPLRQNPREHLRQVKQIIRAGKYDIIHTHGHYKNIDCLFFAWLYGIKKRISHSHIAFIPESWKEKLARKLLVPITKLLATELYACGEDAAIWMWGERVYKRGSVRIMVNGIETKKFVFSEEKRAKLREELNLSDRFVVGCVARLSYQKNHEFMVKIFKQIKERKNNAVLLLVGQGELEQDIRAQVKAAELSDDVIFLGVRDDVCDLLNAMDVFVLPSRFEGLGIVYVEAQANGLFCYASEKVVPKAADVAGMLRFLPLEDPPEKWAEEICNAEARLYTDNSESIVRAGYDIEKAAQEQKAIYEKM